MALILPKGIVVNSDKINESIEKIAAEPLDQAEIARFWKSNPTKALVGPQLIRTLNSLYHYKAQTTGPHGRASRELLAAYMVQRQERPKCCNYCPTL